MRQYDEANGRSRELLREVLREERRRTGNIGRTELAVWSVCTAIVAAALSVGAFAALHLSGA
jgi:hypothetical protein